VSDPQPQEKFDTKVGFTTSRDKRATSVLFSLFCRAQTVIFFFQADVAFARARFQAAPIEYRDMPTSLTSACKLGAVFRISYSGISLCPILTVRGRC
jgi:hypothetical protein